MQSDKLIFLLACALGLFATLTSAFPIAANRPFIIRRQQPVTSVVQSDVGGPCNQGGVENSAVCMDGLYCQMPPAETGILRTPFSHFEHRSRVFECYRNIIECHGNLLECYGNLLECYGNVLECYGNVLECYGNLFKCYRNFSECLIECHGNECYQ
ncbi:hypothetical protein HDU98_011749 [Podochytrium sp. JEL0797]|nr:hypothetical protein HDU98_011749 [Podochytrium sp. JEL0797]